jgi:hypothetical protein
MIQKFKKKIKIREEKNPEKTTNIQTTKKI